MSASHRFSRSPRITPRSRAHGLFRRLSLLAGFSFSVVGFSLSPLPPDTGLPPGDQVYIYENGVGVNETGTVYYSGGHVYYGTGTEIVLNFSNDNVYDTHQNVVGYIFNPNG